ncbi:MAG: DUF2470 domain-containing protein [Rhodovibrionaceae bacterium]
MTQAAASLPDSSPGGNPESAAYTARRLLRATETAALATELTEDRGVWPYGSAVLAASDCRGRPLLLLSDLAEHSRNLLANSRASLLIGPQEGPRDNPGDPLERPRVTLLGELRPCPREEAEPRYLRRFPQAALYKDFKDFNFYRLEVARGHLVAGFGRIDWLAAEDLLFEREKVAPLAAAEADILEHMNADHADALALIAGLFGGGAADWRIVGVDPEGVDLVSESNRLRVPFGKAVFDAEACRVELVGLTKRARREAAGQTP